MIIFYVSFLVLQIASRFKAVSRNKITCSAVQESSTSTSGLLLNEHNQNFGLVYFVSLIGMLRQCKKVSLIHSITYFLIDICKDILGTSH